MAVCIFPDIEELVCPSCNHGDCREWKRRATTPCPMCGEMLESGDRYYIVKDTYVHAECLEDCGGSGEPDLPSVKATGLEVRGR